MQSFNLPTENVKNHGYKEFDTFHHSYVNMTYTCENMLEDVECHCSF